jgi:hypothetical protein
MSKRFVEGTNYFLIIGPPRSGTTLLASIIGSHKEVAVIIEDLNFTIRKMTGKKFLGNKLCIPNQIEISKKGSKYSRLLKKIGLGKRLPTSKYSIKDYLSLPNFNIIAILRDGNNVVSSIMSRGNKKFEEATYRWRRAVEIIDFLLKNNKNIIVINFEDLVVKTESTIRSVLDFLGLDYYPEILEGYKYNILYPESSNIKSEKANPVNQFNLNISDVLPETYSLYKRLSEMYKVPESKIGS